MESAMSRFEFRGDALDVVRTDDGDVAVPVRRLCEVLGVELPAQLRKLKSASWARVIMMITHDAGGRLQEVACLHRRSIPMFAASISETKVRPDARPKLVAWQLEASEVLADHFIGPRGAPKATVLDAAQTLTQQAMRVEDDPLVALRLRRAIRRAMAASKRSWPAVEGLVRRTTGSPGWKRVALFNVPRAIAVLEAVEDGVVLLPRDRPKLRLLQGGKAKQLDLQFTRKH